MIKSKNVTVAGNHRFFICFAILNSYGKLGLDNNVSYDVLRKWPTYVISIVLLAFSNDGRIYGFGKENIIYYNVFAK
ncbi:MAG: hypothetical protein LBD84_02460 [Campylobacteraceae bacterium]|jgi:hypothetical protein|nr:hypothetical protein [Campylobacteraceae bacterium]